MAKRRLLQFGLFMVAFYALLYGLLASFKDNSHAATALIAATVVAGLIAVRPGWNFIPRRIDAATLLVYAVTVASALPAAIGLVFLGIASPYDTLQIDFAVVMPLVLAIAGIEELLFRQIIYRWLEQGQLPQRTIVLATAVAWAYGHLGGALTPAYAVFVLLQCLYLIWIGVLLGELRRRTRSWLASWIGHAAYNMTFLCVFTLIR